MEPMTPGGGEALPPQEDMVVLVSFHAAGKLFPYTTPLPAPAIGTLVVVPTERGPTLATVGSEPREAPAHPEGEIVPILRVATPEDLTQEDRNREREQRGTRCCLTLISRHALPMKLVKVHYLLAGQKAIFYFTADGRIDFRALVKDLARELRVRVEMRQIGVRDETKMVGGVGHCGLELCCSTWLRDFVPVSIRMAKDQNLALNPQKVSGACGRLLCCLAYEHETYVENRKEMPKVGRRVNTTAGAGKVVSLEVLSQRFVLQLDDGSRHLLGMGDLLESTAAGPRFSRESRRAVRDPSDPSEGDEHEPLEGDAEGPEPEGDDAADARAAHHDDPPKTPDSDEG